MVGSQVKALRFHKTQMLCRRSENGAYRRSDNQCHGVIGRRYTMLYYLLPLSL